MKKLKSPACFTLIITIALIFSQSCSTVPITNRKQTTLLPESELIALSLTNYSEFLSTNKVSRNMGNTLMVKEVGKNITIAVEKFLNENRNSSRIEKFRWEYTLIENNEANAWCMPGGKVVIYTGIIPYTKNIDGLAVVMGHEIAHAVARHGNERMSQQIALQFGASALSTFFKDKPKETQIIFNTAIGLGAELGIMLPYSRLHEYEADKLGMIFMAMAGYNPNEAIEFWKRMSQKNTIKPPEFLSTHPSDEKRVKALQEFLPKAMKYYNKEKKHNTETY